MNKAYLSPILNMVAMLLLIVSRLISEKKFDWLAIAGCVIFLLSGISLFRLIKKSK
ncbi:hypothetical protein GCM10022271_07090 [Corallibacter vietnamensis]|uniref:ABC transporter permease n=1 Tax=Corallibacter vietnamensis TaxID=904130 RepID=A0ABP7GYU1_9FLAO